jgi:hypothetical protein
MTIGPNPFEPPHPAAAPSRRPYWRRKPYRFRDDPFVWLYGMVFVTAMSFHIAKHIGLYFALKKNAPAPQMSFQPNDANSQNSGAAVSNSQ